MTDVGTLAWARRTEGRLRLRDKLALLADATALQVRVLPAQLRWQLGLADSGAIVDISTIAVPDSRVATLALERCREASQPDLVNHCLRTYLWAQALAVTCGVHPDAELLWTAAMLHYLGLTERYREADDAPSCFAIRSAEAASGLAREAGWSETRCDALAEVITLHLNVAVDVDHGIEALLLNAASALDVTGLRIWELHATTIRAVVDRYPRLQMKNELTPLWHREAEAHPDSRAHFLSHWLGFERRIRSAPFVE